MALSTMDMCLRPAAAASLPVPAVERARYSGQCGRLGSHRISVTPSVPHPADWLHRPGAPFCVAYGGGTSGAPGGLARRAVAHADFPGGLTGLVPIIGGDGFDHPEPLDTSVRGGSKPGVQPLRPVGSTERGGPVNNVPPGSPPEVPGSSQASGDDPQDWASLVREARELLSKLPPDSGWSEEIAIALEQENSFDLPWLVESGWFDVLLARIASAGERFGLAELDCVRHGFCLDLRVLEEPTPEQAAANGTGMPSVKIVFEGGARPLRHRPVGERPVAVVTEFETGHLGQDRARHVLAAVLAAHDLVVTQSLHFRLDGGQMPTDDDIAWAVREATSLRVRDVSPQPHPEAGGEWVARMKPPCA